MTAAMMSTAATRTSYYDDNRSGGAGGGGRPATSVVVRMLYLIRHGEACHNVQEKLAQKLALQKALEDGLDPDCEETRRRVEKSRREILDDPQFFDAPLSSHGQEQAREAAARLRRLADEYGEPQEVLVSPLERTLKTAATIFPDHSNVRVREELREKLTGRPADEYAPSEHITRRRSFTHFSFKHLRLGSFVKMRQTEGGRDPSCSDGSSGDDDDCESSSASTNDDSVRSASSANVADDDDEEERHFRRGLIECTLGRSASASSLEDDGDFTEREDEEKLRIRARRLLKMIAQSKAETIAIVTHKAYLRALERSAFGQPDAPEFDNCEVRVYRVTLSQSSSSRHYLLDGVERLR